MELAVSSKEDNFTPSTLADRRERELELLASINCLLARQFRQRQMLTSVLNEIEERLGVRRATIMLLTMDGEDLVVEATRDREQQDSSAPHYTRGEGVVGRVVKKGERAIIHRICDEPRFCGRIHDRRGEDFRNLGFICVPILLGSEVVGTLSVDVHAFSEKESEHTARILEIVSGLIAFDVKARRLAMAENQAIIEENDRLKSELQQRLRPENIIGNSRAMREVYKRIHQVAESDTTVLVRGESGTGKELVASAVHYASHRKNGPFVRVNCAALSETLLESELFGHEKGAFTGAISHRLGRIEEAHGGTLFLDEIGDFSPAVQVKLLCVLQQREFQRVGSNQTIFTDIRIIAATNRDLEDDVAKGLFRQDLYYRINVFPIMIPPLRKRKDDILLLADHFVKHYAARMNRPVRRISTPAIDMMFAYHWPGNVRELENCIEHAVLLSTDDVIHGHSLPPTLQVPTEQEPSATLSFKERVDLLERELISDALKQCKGNVAAAARILGLTPRIARYKINNLDLNTDKYR